MTKDTQEKLARSLTAETADLLPFLPYLLQDIWELGSVPHHIIRLMQKHVPLSQATKVLDLACGKGAVSVKIAQTLGVHVDGFDLLAEFIAYARGKADEYGVSSLCRFAQADANTVVQTARGYDCVIFGAAGNILGDLPQTLRQLRKTITPRGFVLIDAEYLSDHIRNEDIKYRNYDYLTHSEWLQALRESGLHLIEEILDAEDCGYDFDGDNAAILARATELSAQYPDKRLLFEGYVQSQRNECADIQNHLSGGTCILQSV
jgi:SAM-dependent methyltransferase